MKKIKFINPEFNCESALSQEIKRLEECRKDRQNDLCAILEKNIHNQRTACEGNETLQSVENVTKEIFQLLNQSLTNYSTSDQRTIVNFLLESVETTILTIFTKEPSNLRINTSELEAVMKVARESCDSNSSFLTLELRRNSMLVPCGLVPGDNDGAFFVTYTDLQTSLNQVILSDSVSPQWFPSSVINSQVVTGSITVREKENLDPPVSFYLKHLQTVDDSMTTLCVYWDPASQAWSRRGCVTQFSNGTHTLCSCSHVSSFAILTSLKDFQEDGGLTLLSRIGLSISIFCLAVSFLTFLLCRSIRSAHTSVLMALIGCLFLGQLLFLLGAHQTRNKLLCSIIAGGLHFFFLCAFCWMFLESVLLFLTVRNLRAMNYLTAKRHHFPYVCVVGFGVPVIVVTVSAVIYPHEYGTERYCWLGPIVIWSFLGPVLVLIVINTTLLIATLCLLQVKLASLNTNVSTLKDKRLLIFKALAQIFILGCTWIFGFFQFGPGARVMSYVFTGLNSLQGAFILLVHCLLNQQVRNEYRKIFHRIHTKRSSLDATSKNTIPLSTKSTNAYELSH
ncbi:adhesion G protein-coupled receptor E2-like [Spea bombifrons]|uniref:adhesion G protein-coupled receptor E2-like n=1 Tax=Spea bombifrons TaxID=233779 RepID=UPI00234BE118|nr:adhesion G protein-coupled receptor E2-like [Spea bombifrons]